MDAVLEKGSWFIGGHFLSIRPWEPFFKPSTANVSLIAVWVRLHELPMELYEAKILKQIGASIGKVLWIDSHTAMEARGRYARLCIQVDINEPLINTILIGEEEGASRKQTTSPRRSHDTASTMPDNGTNKDNRADLEDDRYGPWMTVTRRRPGQRRYKNFVSSEAPTRQVSSMESKNNRHCLTNNLTKLGRSKELGTDPKENFLYNGPMELGLALNINSDEKTQVDPLIRSSPSAKGKKEIARNRASKIIINTGTRRAGKQHPQSSSTGFLLSNNSTRVGFDGSFQFTASISLLWDTKFKEILKVYQMERCEVIDAETTAVMGCFGRKRRMIASIEMGVFWKKVLQLLLNLILSEINIFSMARGMIAREMEQTRPYGRGECRKRKGVLKPNFQTHVREVTQIHNPALLVITKTRLGGDRAKKITNRLPFEGAIHSKTIGHSGGIWLLWNLNMVEVVHLASIKQEIHVEVKVLSSSLSWIFSAIYASLRSARRCILWKNLAKVAELHNKPWVIVRDFNEPLLEGDKFGGRPVNFSQPLLFKECLDKCNMVDMGFNGPRFTWSNRRDVNNLIQERIDRFFTNPSWCLLYPNAKVSHLTRFHSDHCPVLLETSPRKAVHLSRPFRLQSFWLSDLSFPSVVSQAWRQPRKLPEAMEKFSKEASSWNKNHFGNIFGKKRRIMARLRGVQSAMAYDPSSSLFDLENHLLRELDVVLD
ncbi:uncharacterized protein LOC142616504 [Castanea sativa]|uniref:uncharacterized protein LOC142616504 n=1 Tax=Castanea sativa TaxID=21020 RepID=UPI003F6492B1